MKKNLRIVSAAAAALLAVAPVAATVVPSASTTVSAATTTANGIETQTAASNATNSQLGTAAANYVKSINSFNITGANGVKYTLTPANGINQTYTGSVASTTTNANGGKSAVVNVTGTYIASSKPGAAPSQQNGIVYNVTASSAVTDDSSFEFGGATYSKSNDFANMNNNNTVFQIVAKNIAVPFNLTGAANATTGTMEDTSSYFATSKGNALANNSTVYATNGQSNYLFNTLANNGTISISDLKSQIEYVLSNSVFNLNGKGVSNKTAWNEFVFGAGNATSDANIISQLEHQGIKVAGDVFSANQKSLTLTVRSNGGMVVTVVFNNEDYVNTAAPVLMYRTLKNGKLGKLENLVNSNGTVNNLSVPQNDDASKWQPTQWFTAYNSANQSARINVSFSDDNVDITKPGLYSITVSATNTAGKTTKAVVPVVVSAKDGTNMTVAQNTNIYTEENGKMVQSNILNYRNLANGQQVTVFDKVTVDGTDYYRLFSPNSNFFVPASALKGYVAPTTNTDGNKVTKTIMRKAAYYNGNGTKIGVNDIGAYNTVDVYDKTVEIKGKTFYKLTDKVAGQDAYIKASNIDGTKKTLKKNSYIYKRSATTGKFSKVKNYKSTKKLAGSKVTVFGGRVYGNWYRIGKNQYLRTRNF